MDQLMLQLPIINLNRYNANKTILLLINSIRYNKVLTNLKSLMFECIFGGGAFGVKC